MLHFDGWNEANKPYLKLSTLLTPLWLKINGAQTASGVVDGGGVQNLTIQFEAAGLSVGTYTCDINILTNEPGAKKTYVIPVSMKVGYVLSGNVYYGHTGISKPQVTTTTVTLTPGTTQNAGAGGSYRYRALANGNYSIIGASGKAWTGLNSPDPTLAQRYILGLQVLTDLQKRAADVNLTGTIQSVDVTMLKRRLVGQTYASVDKTQ